MLRIGLIDGSYYEFEEFTKYEITEKLVIVKKDETWIGIFDRDQFASLIYNENQN